MNLVDLIKDQLTGEMTSKLSSLIGGGEAQTRSALGAAIPALLSAFSGLASTGGGEKLASTLNEFKPESLSKFATELSQTPGQAVEQGTNMLESLLGGSTLTGLASALAKFAGLDLGSLKKLLAIAAPFVMGAVSKQLQGRPATAQGLRSLFAEQKANIAEALPAGLNLSGIPGLPDLGAMAGSAAATARRAADEAQNTGASLLKTLLPVGALALLALLGWQIFQGQAEKTPAKDIVQTSGPNTVRKPVLDAVDAIPDAAKISDGLTTVFSQTTEALNEITDVPSAEAALPKLDKLSTQLDGLSAMWSKVPATARTSIVQLAAENLGKLTELIEKVQAIPGVGEKLTPVLDGLVAKLKAFEGEQ